MLALGVHYLVVDQRRLIIMLTVSNETNDQFRYKRYTEEEVEEGGEETFWSKEDFTESARSERRLLSQTTNCPIR